MIDSTWYVKPNGIRESMSAGGVIVRKEGQVIWVALVRESENDDYILPKGRVEPGEAAEQAARREIEEEAGLTGLQFLANLGTQERLNFQKTEWKTTYYYLYLTDQVESHPTDPYHAYRCDWFSLDDLPPMFWPEQRELIETNHKMIQELVGIKG